MASVSVGLKRKTEQDSKYDKKKRKKSFSINGPDGLRPKNCPLSERQQLALVMQLTAEQNNATQSPPTVKKTPSSSSKRDKINKRNERGETALHLATIKDDVSQIKELLLQGADIDVADYAGWTPLHEACNRGYLNAAKFLLIKGANVNPKGLNDAYPLHDAVENDHHEVVKLLLDYGADPHLTNRNGQKPLDMEMDKKMKRLFVKQQLQRSSSSPTKKSYPRNKMSTPKKVKKIKTSSDDSIREDLTSYNSTSSSGMTSSGRSSSRKLFSGSDSSKASIEEGSSEFSNSYNNHHTNNNHLHHHHHHLHQNDQDGLYLKSPLYTSDEDLSLAGQNGLCRADKENNNSTSGEKCTKDSRAQHDSKERKHHQHHLSLHSPSKHDFTDFSDDGEKSSSSSYSSRASLFSSSSASSSSPPSSSSDEFGSLLNSSPTKQKRRHRRSSKHGSSKTHRRNHDTSEKHHHHSMKTSANNKLSSPPTSLSLGSSATKLELQQTDYATSPSSTPDVYDFSPGEEDSNKETTIVRLKPDHSRKLHNGNSDNVDAFYATTSAILPCLPPRKHRREFGMRDIEGLYMPSSIQSAIDRPPITSSSKSSFDHCGSGDRTPIRKEKTRKLSSSNISHHPSPDRKTSSSSRHHDRKRLLSKDSDSSSVSSLANSTTTLCNSKNNNSSSLCKQQQSQPSVSLGPPVRVNGFSSLLDGSKSNNNSSGGSSFESSPLGCSGMTHDKTTTYVGKTSNGLKKSVKGSGVDVEYKFGGEAKDNHHYQYHHRNNISKPGGDGSMSNTITPSTPISTSSSRPKHVTEMEMVMNNSRSQPTPTSSHKAKERLGKTCSDPSKNKPSPAYSTPQAKNHHHTKDGRKLSSNAKQLNESSNSATKKIALLENDFLGDLDTINNQKRKLKKRKFPPKKPSLTNNITPTTSSTTASPLNPKLVRLSESIPWSSRSSSIENSGKVKTSSTLSAGGGKRTIRSTSLNHVAKKIIESPSPPLRMPSNNNSTDHLTTPCELNKVVKVESSSEIKDELNDSLGVTPLLEYDFKPFYAETNQQQRGTKLPAATSTAESCVDTEVAPSSFSTSIKFFSVDPDPPPVLSDEKKLLSSDTITTATTVVPFVSPPSSTVAECCLPPVEAKSAVEQAVTAAAGEFVLEKAIQTTTTTSVEAQCSDVNGTTNVVVVGEIQSTACETDATNTTTTAEAVVVENGDDSTPQQDVGLLVDEASGESDNEMTTVGCDVVSTCAVADEKSAEELALAKERDEYKKMLEEYLMQNHSAPNIETLKPTPLPAYYPISMLMKAEKSLGRRVTPYTERLNIDRIVGEKRRRLAPVISKKPDHFWDFLTYTGGYRLHGHPESRLSISVINPPPDLSQPMQDLYVMHEAARTRLRVRHVIEREKLILSSEQEIMRAHARAARTIHNQQIPYSACSFLLDEEVYKVPELNSLCGSTTSSSGDSETKTSIRDRFNKRTFTSWMQDVTDKFDQIKGHLLCRQRHEAAALFAVQRMEWALKLQEMNSITNGGTDHLSHEQQLMFMDVDECYVPLVNIGDDFKLLPKTP